MKKVQKSLYWEGSQMAPLWTFSFVKVRGVNRIYMAVTAEAAYLRCRNYVRDPRHYAVGRADQGQAGERRCMVQALLFLCFLASGGRGFPGRQGDSEELFRTLLLCWAGEGAAPKPSCITCFNRDFLKPMSVLENGNVCKRATHCCRAEITKCGAHVLANHPR